jgi:hypothetical protein
MLDDDIHFSADSPQAERAAKEFYAGAEPPGRALLDAALEYATEYGWESFPAPPGTKMSHKSAASSNGRRWGATRIPAEIERDRRRWPNANIGLPTGADNGFFVIETDTAAGGHKHDGASHLAALEAQNGALPATLEAESPSGSIHRYYRHPGQGFKIKNSASEIAPGVDCRGDGGMVVAPPSVVPPREGRPNGNYKWRNNLPIADAPEWLLALVESKPQSPEPELEPEPEIAPEDQPFEPSLYWGDGTKLSRRVYAETVLTNLCHRLANTRAGRRNTELNDAAFLAAMLFRSGALGKDATRIQGLLHQSMVRNGYIEDEKPDGARKVRATTFSGWNAGLKHVWVWNDTHAKPEAPEINTLPPLTLEEWQTRDLPPKDFLLGNWLTTTTRCLLTADTGLGKTNLSLAFAIRVAGGLGFLHWKGHRKCRVLYIDGEMSRALLQQRLQYETDRIGELPEGFRALSREDIPEMLPLNDPRGQAWLDAFIEKIGGADLVVFDNIMCLLSGNPKDPEAWQATLPYALELTKRGIGQIWIHHTGHDASRSYGDKSREWQMDTTIHLDAVKRPDTDVSFKAKFPKARERTPQNRQDFQDVVIALVDDQWEHTLTAPPSQDKINPTAEKFLMALCNVIGSDSAVKLSRNRKAAKLDDWKAECVYLSLIDDVKSNKGRALFSKHKLDLITHNRIACQGQEYAWLLT